MLSLSRIEAIAPDQAALAAAAKLLKPAAWPLLARDPAGAVVWGEAQGSGSSPYRLMFDPADGGHKCSCPSRKFPCKHVLALMWQFVDHPDRFTVGEPAPWVSEWLSRRRPSTPGGPKGQTVEAGVAGQAPGRGASLAAIPAAAPETAPDEGDVETEAAAARRRERLEAAREASVTEGLEALEVWLGDQLNAGLAGFPGRAPGACRMAAQRLVDAKAAALAARLDALPAGLFARPEDLREDFAILELGRLRLIAGAWRRRAGLDPTLEQDLRRAIGWSVRREALLADPSALRRTGSWIVAGTRSVVQPDRLRRTETWLCAERPAESGPGAALLLDFTPVQAGPAGGELPPGEAFEAELVFYPSPAPLRALIAARTPATRLAAAPDGGPTLADAFAAHRARVTVLPWIEDDMLRAGAGRIVAGRGGLWLSDEAGALALPLAPDASRAGEALLSLPLAGLAGIWDGQRLTLLAASTPHGPWFAP
jgi:hypothetical protein